MGARKRFGFAAVLLCAATAGCEPDRFLGFTGQAVGDAGTQQPQEPFSVPEPDRVINRYVALAADAPAGTTSLQLKQALSWPAGALVIVWQTALPDLVGHSQGAIDVSATSLGSWQFARVREHQGAFVQLDRALTDAYKTPGAQMVLVPEYGDVTIAADASLVAAPWDGETGGIVALVSSGTVLAAGHLGASGAGFRGGAAAVLTPATANCSGADEPVGRGAEKGEGFAAKLWGSTGRGASFHGGGGGVCWRSGGGGGACVGPGGQGGNSSNWDSSRKVGGEGGRALIELDDRLIMGGGGGGGHGGRMQLRPGGAGGGVVLVWARRVVGNFEANGRAGQNALNEGASGGGGGGTLWLRVDEASGQCGRVEALGGSGGNVNINDNAAYGPGGGGGGGHIRLEAAGTECVATSAAGRGGVLEPDRSYGALGGGTGQVLRRTEPDVLVWRLSSP